MSEVQIITLAYIIHCPC